MNKTPLPSLKEINDYKESNKEDRAQLAQTLSEKYPGRIPVIFLRSKRCSAGQLTDNKMIFQPDWHLGQVVGVLRKKLKTQQGSTISESTGIFITLDHNISPKITTRMDVLYDNFKDKDDKFLYMIYSEEDTAGSDQ